MKDSEKQETSFMREVKLGFLYGFFSTAGMLVAMSAYTNRERIKKVIRYAIQEAR